MMEYFNTFGGNPVACAVGLEVLAVMSEKRGTDRKRIAKEIKSIKALLKSSERCDWDCPDGR